MVFYNRPHNFVETRLIYPIVDKAFSVCYPESMSEGGVPTEALPKNIQKDIKRAEKLVAKKEKLIDNPIARTNLFNPDFTPTDEVQKLHEDIARRLGYTPLKLAHTVPESLAEEIKKGERIADPETGQNFNVLRLNWDKFTDHALVFLPAYNDRIEKREINMRLKELARQTGVPTLSIDFPHMGESDDLTPEQVKCLKEEKSYREVAKAQIRVLESLGIKNIDIVGISMGGWAAAEIAKSASDSSITVDNAIIIDAPGVEEFDDKGFIDELSKREMSQGKYVDLYQSAPYNPEMRKAGIQDKSEVTKKINVVRWLARTFRQDPGGVYKKAMARKTLPETLHEALKRNPKLKVTDIHGTTSPVSPTEANREMMSGLKSEFGERTREIMLPGEGHMLMENATRFAPTVKMVLETNSA